LSLLLKKYTLRSAEISSVFIYIGYKLIHHEFLICYHFTGYQTLRSLYCIKKLCCSPFLLTSSQYHQVTKKTLK
jgi:hypothetical protein